MKLEKDKIVMSTEEFLINSLATGIACQLLAQKSNLDVSDWVQVVTDRAEKQYKQMLVKQREEMINSYTN